MTAQIDDLFRYQGVEYSLAGISEGELFDPSLFGLRPTGIICTACYRGYQAVFAIADSRLVLDSLRVNLFVPGGAHMPQEGPPINGVSPMLTSYEHDLFSNHYVGIGYCLEYTGGLLLARGFIEELYVPMGFQPAWRYRNVVELVFESGTLLQEIDWSERMAEHRERLAKLKHRSTRRPTEEEIRDFVERSFDRSYKR